MNTHQIEDKYNIKLSSDGPNSEGETTYSDLRSYFIKELEEEGSIIIDTNVCHICCHRTDIEGIKKEFNNKIKEIIENEPGPCEDSYGVGCSTIDNNVSTTLPPPYNN